MQTTLLPETKNRQLLNIFYIILIYSVIINVVGATGIYLANRTLAWLIYISVFILAGGIPLWALAVYLYKEKAFKIMLLIKILDLLALTSVIYDRFGHMVIKGITVKTIISSVIIALNLPVIYYMVKFYYGKNNN